MGTVDAARVKPTNSGYFVVADFSLFFPKTCRWRLSATENYKFDLRTFHRALSLRQLNIRLIANTWLPALFTCSNHYRDISHVRANAYAHYRKNGNKFSSITANNGIHNPWTRFNVDKDYLHLHWTTLTTVGNKTTIHIVTASCVDHRNQWTKSCLTLQSKR